MNFQVDLRGATRAVTKKTGLGRLVCCSVLSDLGL
jgi:hypothetical protein